MKKFLLGASALVVISAVSPASAADLAARPYTKAPPMMAAYYDWSGFYIGANGGWGNMRDCWSTVGGLGLGCHDSNGGVAGGQVGYRWQSAGWVFGLEAQGDWADLRGSHADLFVLGREDFSEMNAFGLFTGQLGYAWNNALLYVKGGAAVTDTRFEAGPIGFPTVAGTGDVTRWGGTVGVGLEYGFAPNWSAAVEYDHLFMNRHNSDFFFFADNAFAATGNVGGDVDLVTVRVNYRWGGPVIGRY